tara:strand:- start:1448 stop:1699 length:252 start_codon:yes stop_codon:yes gene_type:complete
MKKIKEEQLDKIKKQQETLAGIISEVGYIETKKHSLLHDLASVNMEVESYKKELEKEYGSVNIDLETGEYTEIEKEELQTEDV